MTRIKINHLNINIFIRKCFKLKKINLKSFLLQLHRSTSTWDPFTSTICMGRNLPNKARLKLENVNLIKNLTRL